mmetsp:Transcript_94967/g.130691  ORF Transcript_94967/g.130691 Transcript_94967/m.130691 type:complete len:106 (+) Transcript_94967:44-361(+)
MDSYSYTYEAPLEVADPIELGTYYYTYCYYINYYYSYRQVCTDIPVETASTGLIITICVLGAISLIIFIWMLCCCCRDRRKVEMARAEAARAVHLYSQGGAQAQV